MAAADCIHSLGPLDRDKYDMTSADMVDAALARAEKALESREVSDLAMAAEVLRGMLDWAAKAEHCETLVSDVLRTVTDELRVQRG